MKFFSIIVFLFFCFHFLAQSKHNSGFYINYSYLFSEPNSIVGMQQKDIYGTELSISTIRGSLGSGNLISFGSTIQTNSNFSLGIQYNYFKSSPIVLSIIDAGYNSMITNDTNAIQLTEKFQSKLNYLNPYLQFHFSWNRLKFYLNTGFLLPISSFTNKITESKVANNFYEYQYERIEKDRFNYNFAIGFSNTLGLELNLHKQFKLNIGIQTNIFNLTLKSKKVQEVIENGVNITSSLSKYNMETKYHEEINFFSNNAEFNNSFDEKIAKDELTQKHSFNSLGLQVGICYRLKK